MLCRTGALLMQEAAIMAMPISLARRRRRHGVDRRGRVERHVVGVTRGEGSVDQAHWAMVVRSGCCEAIVKDDSSGKDELYVGRRYCTSLQYFVRTEERSST
eukprot:scaffold1248_cov104-Skeletonema_marinoi.AAC.10